MTWSIIARDAEGRFGVAIASRFLAVGSLCVWTRGGVGAICTQALVNPLYGPDGLALLAHGRSAEEAIAALTGADEGAPQRQLHLWPAKGAGAAYTGGQCHGWAGHLETRSPSSSGCTRRASSATSPSSPASLGATRRPESSTRPGWKPPSRRSASALAIDA
jgi:uncharacterized Ntn-hydrolase superfamily protein